MPSPPLVEPGPPLLQEQRARYARQLQLPAVGELGQRRLLAARVAVVGAGGLGSPALLYLAAAGVGHLTVVDADAVDDTNLQRQVIHDLESVGVAKTDSALERLRALNPDVDVTGHRVWLDPDNARDLLAGHDVVVDGSDNLPTRYAVDDACADLDVPLVWATVQRADAQVSVFWRRHGLALRDLFPTPADEALVPACADAGVLGALVGQVGSIMAGEVVKLVLGAGEPLLGRVLYVDSLAARTRELPLRPRLDSGPLQPPGAAPATTAVAGAGRGVSARDLAARLAGPDAPVVLDVREPGEVALGAIPGSVHVPLGVLEADPGAAHLPGDRDVVVTCKRGPRADRAAGILRGAGHERVEVLTGGMIAWIEDVDPSLPRC